MGSLSLRSVLLVLAACGPGLVAGGAVLAADVDPARVAGEVGERLEASRLATGQAPLRACELARAHIRPLRVADPARYAELERMLAEEMRRTRDAMMRQQLALSQLAPDREIERLRHLAALIELSGHGANPASRDAARRRKLLDVVTARAEAAAREGRDDDAAALRAVAARLERAGQPLPGTETSPPPIPAAPPN